MADEAPLDRHARAFLRMLETGVSGSAAAPSIVGRRQALRDLVALADPALEPVAESRNLLIPGPAGGVPARLYVPLRPAESDRRTPGMVFLHGGGWVSGDLETHDGFCRRLANASGCRLVAVDYRLAPEHPFPAALDDAMTAVTWVAANAASLGIDPSRLVVAGDSAGGGLAAAVCQQAVRNGGPVIALQLLVCPILDLASETPSRREFAEGYFLDAETVRRDIADYSPPGADLADPRLSPSRTASLAGLPAAIVHTAQFDPFRDEGETYANRLSQSASASIATRHAGQIHFFYALPGLMPAAVDAIERMGGQVRAALHGNPTEVAARPPASLKVR